MIGTYRDAGFAHLRAALDPSLVADWRPHLLDAVARLPNAAMGLETAAVFQLDRLDPTLEAILRSPQLGRIAASVLGTDAVRLASAAAYIKPPGAPATFWHQDLWFFPIVGAPMTTLWLPLSPVEQDTAPLLYAAGSHRGGFANWTDDAAPRDWPLHTLSPMVMGDVVLHDGWMLHGSTANTASRPREAIGLSYVRADTRFATRAELRAEPGRWAWIEGYLDHADYREGAPIAGPGCPLIDLS